MKFTKKRLLEIVTENIEEMAMDFETGDRPDDGVQDKLKQGDTTFKKVPLPNTTKEGQNFQELLASERYKQVVSKVKHYTGITTDIKGMNGLNPLIQSMMIAHNQIVSLERQNKEQLEQLAVELVMKEMAIPEGSLQFDAKLINLGEVDTNNFNKGQEEEDEENFEIEKDLMDELDGIDFEKAKRRLVNSIIQGSSKRGHYMFHNVEDRLIDITGNNNIINLYGTLMSINDTMYWQLSDETVKAMAGGGGSAVAGKEEVDRNTDPPTIYARGINFPVLVHELIKGIMELFAIQGRPEDEEVYDEVEDSEDTLEKEVWDLRLGPAIWDRIRSQFPEEILLDDNKIELQNYLMVEIFKLPAKKFLVFMKEVLTGSDRGKQMINQMMESIDNMFNDQDYDTEEFNNILDDTTENTDNKDLGDYLKGLGINFHDDDED